MKAYLAWPVKLEACPTLKDLHITLKYLGSIEPIVARICLRDKLASAFGPAPLVAEIEERLKFSELTFTVAPNLRWKPESFNPVTRVLVIEGYDARLRETQKDVAGLRKDDYPNWRPHITLPGHFWDVISREQLTLGECGLSVGPLTLFIDKKPHATFVRQETGVVSCLT